MTFKKLAIAIAMKESKRKQVNIAQIYEILKVLKGLIKENPIEILKILLK